MLTDDNGEKVANVVAPSWSSAAEDDDGTLAFSSDTRYANYSFLSTITSSSFVLVLKDAIENGSVDLGDVESYEEGSGSVDGRNAKWLKALISDGDVYGTVYWGAIDCEDGCVSVASIRLALETYPDFSESEFIEDLNCVTPLE